MEYKAVSINKEENRYRDYTMIIEKSLFGHFLLTCCWGRIGNKKRQQTMIFDKLEDCLKQFDRIKKTREKHNYFEQ